MLLLRCPTHPQLERYFVKDRILLSVILFDVRYFQPGRIDRLFDH